LELDALELLEDELFEEELLGEDLLSLDELPAPVELGVALLDAALLEWPEEEP
jgi:hypothetical protein